MLLDDTLIKVTHLQGTQYLVLMFSGPLHCQFASEKLELI